MTKPELRKIYLQERLAISNSGYIELSHRIKEQFFFHVDLSAVNILHTFLPLKKNKEPDTGMIIAHLQNEFPAIRLCVPRIHTAANRLESFFFEGMHQMAENQWGILQPITGTPLGADKIDMVLVPLLAFDRCGQRVGYGKGYYDRFLATCKPHCRKVGLSFFPPVDKIDPSPGDVPLDCCITPEKVYQFSPALNIR